MLMKKNDPIQIGTIDGVPILLTYKRVKNINFRLTTQALQISAPSYIKKEEILELIDTEKIRRHLLRLRNKGDKESRNEKAKAEGAKPTGLTILGRSYPIRYSDKVLSIGPENGEVLIPLSFENSDDLIEKIDQYLISILNELIEERLTYWKDKTGLYPSQFSIRKMKTRWGSCTPGTGRIRFNFHLIKLPFDCIDAIIIHELVHLKEANHQKGFYDLLYRYFPDYDKAHSDIKTFSEEPYLLFI